jgi:hypothetical protein
MRAGVALGVGGRRRRERKGTGSAVLSAAALLVVVLGSLSTSVAAGSPSGGWLVATLVEVDSPGIAHNPQVGVDESGNAVAVWRQSDGSRYNIWANRYIVSSGWATAQLIETGDAGDVGNPQVAVDRSGVAVAVWAQNDGSRYNIWANRYAAGWGWGTATLIETDNTGDASTPQVAVDGSGNAVAVWTQFDGTWNSIYSNRYAAGTGWGTARLIDGDVAGNAQGPQVALDKSGSAVAVWEEWDGTGYNIWGNRNPSGTGWGNAAPIETANASSSQDPQVAVDASGNAVAVWHLYDSTRYNIWAARYSTAAGWGTSTLIETNSFDAYFPQVALNGAGTAVAVWKQDSGPGATVWSNRYEVASGWGRATLIGVNDPGSSAGAENTQVAVDDRGNAVAVWDQYDGSRYNIWANRYSTGTGWGTVGLIETDNAGQAFIPQVALDGSGNAVAVWEQTNGTRYNILANRLVEEDPPALSLFSPIDGSSTNISSVWVSGAAEVGARVSVNGFAVTVGAYGTFAVPVALDPGLNVLTVTAWDASGNSASASVNVTFVDPVPGLQGQLATAQANASAMMTSLAAAQATLTVAQSRVSALEADANSTQSQLDEAHANLTASQARVSALEASGASTQAALAASQARQAALEANATTAKADLASAQSRITALEANNTARQAAAAPADNMMAILAIAIGAGGLAVGAVALMRSGRAPKAPPSAAPPANPPPKP